MPKIVVEGKEENIQPVLNMITDNFSEELEVSKFSLMTVGMKIEAEEDEVIDLEEGDEEDD